MDHSDRNESEQALEMFQRMVQSVGVKRFAGSLDLSTRQVNRILSGVQPNPVNRMLRSLQSCDPDVGDAVLDHICQEMGGYFIREEGSLDTHGMNAVKECAEAIAAISNGSITKVEEKEIREAIAALIALAKAVNEQREAAGDTDGKLEINISITNAQLSRSTGP